MKGKYGKIYEKDKTVREEGHSNVGGGKPTRLKTYTKIYSN